MSNKIVTHKSHFGIEKVVFCETPEVVHIVSRNKGSLIRLALAIGMEKTQTFHEIKGMDNGVLITNNLNETSYTYKSQEGDYGRIAKWDLGGSWFLQISKETYDKNFANSF